MSATFNVTGLVGVMCVAVRSCRSAEALGIALPKLGLATLHLS